MKVYRYMSEKEFQKFMSGMELHPYRTYHMSRTESLGFCFLPETVDFISGGRYEDEEVFEITFRPEDCIRFLSGIVTNDVLVEMEVSPELLTESRATYADPCGGYDDIIFITEFCADSYSRDNFVPTRYALVPERSVSNTVWYDIAC